MQAILEKFYVKGGSTVISCAPCLPPAGVSFCCSFPSRRFYVPCAGTFPLCQKRSGTKIAQDAILVPAFLEGLRRVHRTGGTESCSKRTPRPAEGMGHRIWLYCNCKRAVGEKE
ncbi:hypothetical protein DXB24_29670 [Lachnospiraceae bacterium OM02-3]|nr:hypothetical protein DXB24_29670 [Lachnospiraceae bacterium OM02-3]